MADDVTGALEAEVAKKMRNVAAGTSTQPSPPGTGLPAGFSKGKKTGWKGGSMPPGWKGGDPRFGARANSATGKNMGVNSNAIQNAAGQAAGVLASAAAARVARTV